MAVFCQRSVFKKKKKTAAKLTKNNTSLSNCCFFSVHPSIHTPIWSSHLMQSVHTYRQFRIASGSPIMYWTSSLFFSLHSGPEPVVQNREILCSCWEEMALIHQSCCPSQTSASPSPAPVSVSWLCLLIPVPSCFWASTKYWLFTFAFFSLPFHLSSHEDWLWKHGGEDGVQWEVCQQGVFQLQATGQPGAADHQTKQCWRFLF